MCSNESLVETIAKTVVAGSGGGRLRKAQVAAVEAGREAFKAFVKEDEGEVEAEE